MCILLRSTTIQQPQQQFDPEDFDPRKPEVHFVLKVIMIIIIVTVSR